MKPTTIQTAQSDSEIAQLVMLFDAKDLPKKKWIHSAHLTVALWYVKHFGKEKAICTLRTGIITYNEAVGIVNSPYGGYHETLTLFWIRVIDSFIKQNTETLFREQVNTFLNSAYADRDLPLRFYSKARLFSIEARAVWVEPDLLSPDFLSVRDLAEG